MGTSVKDHGYAWVVCMASCLAQVVQGGLLYSMGVLYIMFRNGLDAGDGALSLVTSLNYSILYLVGPFVGTLTERFGERRLALVGAVIATLGLAWTSFATKVWHLYLAYSLTAGVGMGMVYNPSISILAKYFDKHKKVAAGISTCGHGVGSFLFPPILKVLDDAFGWRGAILMLAGIAFHYLIFALLYRPTKEDTVKSLVLEVECKDDLTDTKECSVTNGNSGKVFEKEETHFVISERHCDVNGKSYFDKDNKEYMQAKPAIDLGANNCPQSDSENVIMKSVNLLKIVPFLCLCLQGTFIHFPIVLVYTHLGRHVLSLDYSTSDVVLIYMAMGITNTVTRVLLGVLAELFKLNCAVVVMVSALVNGIVTICVPFTTQLSALYVYVVIFCTLITPYNTLFLPIIVDSVPHGRVATAYGIVCFFCVPGTALGAPLAAWLHGMTGGYDTSFYLAGALFIVSGLVMLPGIWQNYKHKTRAQKHMST